MPPLIPSAAPAASIRRRTSSRPWLIEFSTLVFTESFFALLLVVLVAVGWSLAEVGSVRLAVAAGMLGGAAVVTRPEAYGVVLVISALVLARPAGRGTVRKIVDFGAFVEIFPGTDGLVHISQLANERVRKVSDVLKEGDVIDVKVLEVDLVRKRVALTMRLDDPIGEGKPAPGGRADARGGSFKAPAQKAAPANNAFADAFARAKRS